MAASGLPESDANHAANVANFAVAVNYCCKRVLSPLDNSPIKLRIGINSGRCASGIVGVTNPRYCVFGDTVNTTARHESTGEAGRIHSSVTTMNELQMLAPDDFVHQPRGLVEMKGKGQIPTYWLSSTEDNRLTNDKMLMAIDAEIMNKFSDILKQNVKPRSEALAMQMPAPAPYPDETSDEGLTADFNSSVPSILSVPPPVTVSEKSPCNPLASKVLQMLGGFFDGASYGEFKRDDRQVSVLPSREIRIPKHRHILARRGKAN